jgi:hypothetical protein
MISTLETIDQSFIDEGSPGAGVEAAALRCLGESAYPALRCVTCRFDDGVLTMRGSVVSYFLKQMAQTAVIGLAGVERVDNCIDVSR